VGSTFFVEKMMVLNQMMTMTITMMIMSMRLRRRKRRRSRNPSADLVCIGRYVCSEYYYVVLLISLDFEVG
jgi:hypothetical protein